MRYVLSALFVAMLFVFVVLRLPSRSARESSTAPGIDVAQTPVILELFTSEGCSSCPPADAFLKKLDDAGRAGNVEIIAFEEHVDYWDHLGWRDPFSSRKWTERQGQYASALGRYGVYTPQLVVNGREELVGSSERQALRSISEAAKHSGAKLRFESVRAANGSVSIAFAWENLPFDGGMPHFWLAVTERGLSSSVLHGENEGQTLTHASVLRSLTPVKLETGKSAPASSASVTVPLDPSWKSENLRFVIFLQDPKSLHIAGAAASAAPR